MIAVGSGTEQQRYRKHGKEIGYVRCTHPDRGAQLPSQQVTEAVSSFFLLRRHGVFSFVHLVFSSSVATRATDRQSLSCLIREKNVLDFFFELKKESHIEEIKQWWPSLYEAAQR